MEVSARPPRRATIRRPAAPAEHKAAGCLALWGEPIFPGSRMEAYRRSNPVFHCRRHVPQTSVLRSSGPDLVPRIDRGDSFRGAPPVALRFPCTPRCPPGVGYTPRPNGPGTVAPAHTVRRGAFTPSSNVVSCRCPGGGDLRAYTSSMIGPSLRCMGERDARPLRLAIVDDYAVVVAGVASFLEAERIDVVETGASTPVISDVDIVLFDTFGQIQGEGIDLEDFVRHSDAKVVIYSWNLKPELIEQALAAGASGYSVESADRTRDRQSPGAGHAR